MSVATYEAVVEKGQVVLPAHVHLPEHARVFVVVPDAAAPAPLHIVSPRLVYPEQQADFQKLVVREEP